MPEAATKKGFKVSRSPQRSMDATSPAQQRGGNKVAGQMKLSSFVVRTFCLDVKFILSVYIIYMILILIIYFRCSWRVQNLKLSSNMSTF
jgi:hypothetical protein